MSDGAPERRDVLGALGVGGLGGLLRLVETVDATAADVDLSASQADTGFVRDTDERGVPDAEVHAFRMRPAPDSPRPNADKAVEHLGSTVTDEDGRFGIGTGTAIEADVSPADNEIVLLLAYWQGPEQSSASRRQSEWVGSRIYDDVETFRETTAYEIVLDQRLLFSRTVTDEGDPYGTITVWDDLGEDITDITDGPADHVLRMAARSVRDPDGTNYYDSTDEELDDALVDEDLEESHLDSGLFSLQLSEETDHKYKTTYRGSGEDGLPSDPQPFMLWWTAAIRNYREEPVDGHVGETSALLASMDLPVPLYAALPVRNAPTFSEDYYEGTIRPGNFFTPGPVIDIPGETDLSYFIPYWSGGQQANQAEAEQQALDVASFGLGVLSFIPGVGTLVGLGLAGASLGVALLDAASSTPSVPTYARRENRTRIGSGYLEFDLSEFDYVTNGFAYRTYAASQQFSLSEPDDEPEPFEACARGLFKFDRVGENDETRVVDLEHGFEVDPAVRSPLDDDEGVRIVRGSAADAPGEGPIDLQSPLIRGPSSPIIGQDATFVAVPQATFESRLFNPDDAVEAYDWTIARRDLDPFEGGRPTGELIDDEVANGTGRTVSHTFETPGEYTVSVTVTTGDGRTASATRVFEVAKPPLEAVPPVDTDAGEQCVHPTDGDSVPATGEDAASFIAPGWCGTWKEYEATPGYEHVVRTEVDGCADCVLHNASYEIQEPIDGEWQTVRTVTEPRGKAFAGDVHELRYRPTSDRFRVVNRHDQPDDGRNLGIGFYVTVLAPQVDDSEDDDGNEEL